MKVLIIGTGSIGRRHINNLLEICRDAKVALLRQDNKENAFSRKVDAVILTDINKGLEWNPDFVIIASPSSTHADFLQPVLASNLPVYVEKPVVISNQQLEQISKVASSYSAPSLVGCNLRYLPSIKQIKLMLERGDLGNVVRANLVAGQWLPDWRPDRDYRSCYSADSEMGGGVLFDLIHEIDMAQWFFGPFDFALARTGKNSSLEISSEDTAAILLDNEKTGVMVTISLDYVSRRPVRRYEIVGEKGTLIWDLQKKQMRVESATETRIVTDRSEDFDVDATYIDALNELIISITNNTQTSHDIFEGMKTIKLLLTAKNNGLVP